MSLCQSWLVSQQIMEPRPPSPSPSSSSSLSVQTIVTQLGETDMDSIVLAVGQKKTLTKMQQEYEDLVSGLKLPEP